VDILVTNPDYQTALLASGFTYILEAKYSSIAEFILKPKCYSCHSPPGTSRQKPDLTTYTKIMSSGTIIKNQPQSSALYTDVRDELMPKSGTPLSAQQKQAIFDWIASGASNN